MRRRRILLTGTVVVLCCLTIFVQPTSARESGGGGLFIDLAGCLGVNPCANTVVVFPQIRFLVEGRFFAAHFDILPILPTTSALWLPYAVAQFPLEVNESIQVVPYIGIAPVLATANAPLTSIDWMLKLGDLFRMNNLTLYGELILPIPFVAVPSLSFGTLIEF